MNDHRIGTQDTSDAKSPSQSYEQGAAGPYVEITASEHELRRQLEVMTRQFNDWFDTAVALYKAVPEAYRRGQLPEYGKRKPSDTVREVLAELEQQIADQDSALADVAIALDVMAFSLMFAKLAISKDSEIGKMCLLQIKCGLDAYLHVTGEDGLMSEIVKENSADSIDNQQ